MVSREEIDNLEKGKKYLLKISSRKNRIKAELLNKNSTYTGLSLYHGTDAIEIKRGCTTYTVSLYGLESIENANQ